ncbi:MAG: phosphatidate cytidylyltransferase [Deltaproteobacteria bacterium]|nr:phosphatidate cytidylyltransferase [Deltaproteobacteria bacterium]
MILAVISILLYTSVFSVLVAASLLTLLALLEFNRLTLLKIRDSRFDIIGIAAGTIVPPVLYFYGMASFLPVILGALFVFFFYGMFSGRELKDAAFEIAFKTLGIIYIAVPFSMLSSLKAMDAGEWWILFLFAVIWSNDTFAYITGKSFGRHKLCPSISPKKTIEGAIGGLAGGIVAAYLFDHFANLGLGPGKALILSVVLGCVGIIGDLSESLLKRSAGVKDSGTIVPGHGGVLDRVDSLLFAIPALYFFLECQSRITGG